MTYSKNIRKRAVAERMIVSWVIVAVLTAAISFCVGYMISSSSASAAASEDQTITLIYGRTADGMISEGEFTVFSDLEFEPLDVELDEDLQEFIFYLSEGYEIDWTLVMAIIQQESEYDPNAVSPSGDAGLMQISQINAAELEEAIGVTDLMDPYENIKAGLYILRKLHEKYNSDSCILMAYSMGETAAAKLWEQGIYETNYSKSVLKIQKELNEQ